MKVTLTHPKTVFNHTYYEEVWTDRANRRSKTVLKDSSLLLDDPDSEELT